MLAKNREWQLRYVALTHRMRQLACPLAALPVASVLYQQRASPWLWGLMAFNGFLWPQLAYGIARHTEQPRRAEQINFVAETLLVGVWLALMQFNLLPSAMLVAMLAMNHVSAGGWAQMSRSLGLVGLACGAVWWIYDMPLQPVSDMTNIVACLPLLIINPVWLSRVNYTLGRRVRQQNRLLDQLNRTDALTELPNRTHWLDAAAAALQQFQRNQRPAALILLDIDRFKQINDGHGHAAGDEMLRRMANVLCENLRDVDTAGRLGGDEFGAVLPETDGAHASAVAERIRHHIEQLHLLDDDRHRTSTVSLGVAEINEDTGDVAGWVRRADLALYRAKSQGRNRVCDSQPGFHAGESASAATTGHAAEP